jgi:hypothetical protein
LAACLAAMKSMWSMGSSIAKGQDVCHIPPVTPGSDALRTPPEGS